MTAAETPTPAHWHRHDGDLLAVFEAPDHIAGAHLGRALAGADLQADVDVRPTVTRVALRGADTAGSAGADGATAASALVDELAASAGLRPAPQALRQLCVVIETALPDAVAAYWNAVLGHRREGATLRDPLRRRPSLILRVTSSPSEEQVAVSALHLDVSRPGGPAAEDAPTWGGQHLAGPYGVRAADPAGNVADVIPAGPCWEEPAVSAWRGAFSAQAAWRAPSAEQAAAFVAEAAGLADAAGLALGLDRRGDLVIADSGKDFWETEAGFADLAAAVQARAEAAGLREEPDGLGFVQAFVTAVDVPALRAFWARALGYREDPREGVLDLIDPHRLGPVLGFQADEAPPARVQRDPFHLQLALPESQAAQLLEHDVPSLGTVRETGAGAWELTGPEGAVLEILALPAASPV